MNISYTQNGSERRIVLSMKHPDMVLFHKKKKHGKGCVTIGKKEIM